MRGLFFVGIGLLVGGSVLIGNYKVPSSVSTGSALVKAGYAVLAVVLAIIACFGGYLWLRVASLGQTSVRVSIICKGWTASF
jgi:hypothetical protein